MNAVGIDVSKGKSMVAVLRPLGIVVAKPFRLAGRARTRYSFGQSPVIGRGGLATSWLPSSAGDMTCQGRRRRSEAVYP